MVFFQAMQLHASAACDMQHVQCSCASSVPDHLGEQALIRASRMRKILPIASCTLSRNGDSGGGGKRSSDKSSASLSISVPLRNGALDGKPATLFHRWKEHDPRYDPIIAENIKLSRWRQIKRYFKLSMGIEEKKRGEAGYDPCVKYDYIYRCLVHNMNYLTRCQS